MKERLKESVEKFSGKKILVVGDVMLDKYIWGTVSRISPEAPVQVVAVNKETFSPGGAANTANNIASLGGEAHLIGICGSDSGRDILIKELENKGIEIEGMVINPDMPTTQKVRVIGHNQQLLRFDYEETRSRENDDIIENVKKRLSSMDAVIVSDYAKGVVSHKLMQSIIDECNKQGIPVIVDPKPKHKELYKGSYLLTPNASEALAMVNLEAHTDENIQVAAERLNNELKANVLITRGEKGMFLLESDQRIFSIPTMAKEVYDVSGAGDTVVASLALAVAAGTSLVDAAIIANHAAGITVAKVGTSTVSIKELKERIEKES